MRRRGILCLRVIQHTKIFFRIDIIADIFCYTKHFVGHEPKAPGPTCLNMPQVRLNAKGSNQCLMGWRNTLAIPN